MGGKNKLVIIVLLFKFLMCCVGCGGYPHQPVFQTGKTRRIQLYSGNEKVVEWVTTGPIELNGDSYYFKDDQTGRTISVKGTVVIEVE